MESPYLHEMLEREFNSNLYKYKFGRISLWRIFRSYSRFYYLNKKENFIQNTFSIHNKSLLIKNFCISASQVLKLIVKRPHKNVAFLGLPRLYKVNGRLIDKISDPVFYSSFCDSSDKISFNCLYDNYEYQDFSHQENHFLFDAPIVISHGLAFFIMPVVFFRYGFLVNNVFRSAQKIFELPSSFFLKYLYWLSEFICNRFVAKLTFRSLHAKNLILVNRDNYLPFLSAAKQLDMRTIELQHGATHGETPVYSGPYDKSIDPDFFCAFGKAWCGEQFAIPISNIRCLGWAYNDYIKEHVNTEFEELNDSVLVISSPEITEKILDATILLATMYQSFHFAIRLHPHEMLSKEQHNKITNYENISIQDKQIESSLALLQYKYVIGENSSVVYEALSMGKRVARINFAGLSPSRLEVIENDGFIYLRSPEDFIYLTHSAEVFVQNDYYSPFKVSVLKSLLL